MREPRITAVEMRGEGPSRERLLAEVRRLRGLIFEWYVTYAHDSDDLMAVSEEATLLAEARAIREEKGQ